MKNPILLCILFLLVPVLLNIVIGFQAPNNIAIIGEPTDWLLFYGSYIGGVLTAIIGFYTIYREDKRNKIQIQISHKQAAIDNLKGRLADCISLFDYSYVGIISLYFDEPDKYNDVLKDMDKYISKVNTTANAWYIIYGNSNQIEIQEFQTAYAECVNVLIERLNQVTTWITDLKKDVSTVQKTDLIQRINTMINRHDEFNGYIMNLKNKAWNWIATEEQKLQTLERNI